MQKVKSEKGIAEATGLSAKTVTLFMGGQLFVLGGTWQWDLQSEAVFCSEAMMGWPDDFTGTKSIIHPDDKEAVLAALENPDLFQFRIITTYGEVKLLRGKGVFIQGPEVAPFDASLALRKKEEASFGAAKAAGHYALQKTAYSYAERITGSGVWYSNKTTGETWFSDQVFSIYGLSPQSLNAHHNTFYRFIHPDEYTEVVDILEKAFLSQYPLQIEFRIVRPGGTERWIHYTTAWDFTGQGAVLLHGVLQDVTDQKELEQKSESDEAAISFQKQLLHFAEGATNIGYWQINVITKKVVYSDNYFRLFGLKPQSILAVSTTFINYIHPDDRNVYAEVQRRMRKEHTAPEIEYRIVRADGKIRYIRQKGKAIVSGADLLVVGTVQDITVQKTLEKKLTDERGAEAVQRLMLQQAETMAGAGSWLWNIDTDDIEWSANFYDVLGQKPGPNKLTQKILLRSVHPDDQKKFSDELTLTLHQKKEADFTFRLVRRGEVRQMKASFRMAAYDGVAFFIGMVQDNTSLHLATTTLGRQTRLLKAMADALPAQIIVTDTENNIVVWNRHSEAVYEKKQEKVIGHNLFDAVPQLKHEAIFKHFGTVWAGEKVHLAGQKGVQGEKGYFTQTYIPVTDADNTVTGILHIIQDVTAEHTLREELSSRLRFIEELLEVSADRMVVLDRNMNYIYWNKKAEEEYGLLKEEVIGKNILELFPKAGAPLLYTDFRKALRGETVYLPATDQRHEEARLVPVKNEKEEVHAVLWVQHDRRKDFLIKHYETKAIEIVNALNENYFELDREYRVTFINRQALHFFNKNEEAIQGKIIWEAVPETLDTPVYFAWVNAMEDRVPVRDEFVLPVQHLTILVSITPTAGGIAVAFIDIEFTKEAERKLAEEHHKMQEAEGRLRTFHEQWQQLIENSPDIITRWSTDLRLLSYNSAFVKAAGILVPEPVGKNHAELGFTPAESQKFIADIKEASHTKEAIVRYMEYKTPAGVKHFQTRLFPEFGASANIEAIGAVSTDITDLVKAEELLKARTHYAEEIIDASIDQMTVFDKDQRFIAWNKRCEEVGGLAREAVIGKTIEEIFPGVINEPEFLEAQQKALNGEYAYIPSKKGVYTKTYHEWFYVPLKNSKGETDAVLNIIHDISGRVQAEKELVRKNRELEAKNDEITNFAFIASHDLKEPLRKIHTFSNWLLQKEEDNFSGKGKEYVKKLMAAVMRLDALIEDVTSLLQIDAVTETFEPVNLMRVMADAQKELEEVTAAAGAIIKASSLPVVNGHQKQLGYLFVNLLINGIKFQRPGMKPMLEVVGGLYANDEGVHYHTVSFNDNGIGFDPQYVTRIFKVFQRLHGQAEYPGTGIGLAICKKVMENHDGFIQVQSLPGKGATFTCYFPA